MNVAPPSAGEFVMLLTSDQEVQERIHHEALLHYLTAFDHQALECVNDQDSQTTSDEATSDDRGFHLQIACALMPDGEPLLDVQARPNVLPQPAIERIHRRLQSLARPPVTGGPVVFVSQTIFGECRETVDFAVSIPFAAEVGPQDCGETSARASSGCSFSHEQLNHRIDANPDDADAYKHRAQFHRQQRRYQEAVADFDQFLRLAPENVEGWILRGESHCLAGSLERGLSDFAHAVEIQPDNITARNARGVVLLDLEAWDAAAEDFATARRGDPLSATLCVNLAKARFGAGDSTAALRLLDEALALDPHHEDGYVVRALARRQAESSRCLSNPPTASEETELSAAGQLVIEDLNDAIRINASNPRHFAFRAEIRLLCGEFEDAAADATVALDLDGQCAQAYGLRGIARQQLGSYEEAIDDCTVALNKKVASAAVYFSRAVSHERLQHFEDAVRDYDATLSLDPHHAMAMNARGEISLRQELFDDAMSDFNDAVRLAPEWAIPYANRANVHRIRREGSQAIEDYDRALLLDPHLGPAYFNRGLTRLEQTDAPAPRAEVLEQAMKDLDHGLTLLPEFSPGYFSRALAHLELHDYENALADLDRAIEWDPQCAPAFFNRANLLIQQGELDLAMRDFDRLIHLCPTLGAAYSGRGNVWIQKGEHAKALADYHEAIQCDPERAEHYTIRRLVVEAAFLHQQERFIEAISKTDEALALDADCAPAFGVRAAALWYTEQLVEAVEDYTRMLEIDQDCFAAHSGRGQVYAEMGEFKAALADLNRAIELGAETETPTSLAYAFSGRALAHAGLKQFDQSSWDFDRSIGDCPENAWVHYNHALTHHSLGNLDEAAACFELALALNDPPMPPRKRDRARAFLRQHKTKKG